jgi:hypothetical protein
MPKPIVYEVSPQNSEWVVRMEGNSQSEVFDSKADALSRARHLAARQKAALRVLTATGRVEAEYPPPGPRAGT